MSAAHVRLLKFKTHDVRVVFDEEGVPWWIAKDVARVLGMRDAASLTRSLDADQIGTHDLCTPGGLQGFSVINEAGIYAAMFRSYRPEAKAFQRWVIHEILPSIRKTGALSIDQQPAMRMIMAPMNARR